MKGLSPQALKDLLEKPRVKKSKTRTGYAYIRGENGLERVSLKPSEIGRFAGKQTFKRSRKGRTVPTTRRNRRYEGTYNDTMVSYKVG